MRRNVNKSLYAKMSMSNYYYRGLIACELESTDGKMMGWFFVSNGNYGTLKCPFAYKSEITWRWIRIL